MRSSLVLFMVLSGFAAGVSAQAPYLVKDLGNAGSTDPQSSQPKAFLSSGGVLFFTATTETNGLEPWIHDGNGTRLLRDINGGPNGSSIFRFMELTPGVVIFAADDGLNGPELWRSDGTPAGTTLLKIVNATTFSFSPSFAFGGKVFFFVDDGVHGREPWVTDGTAAGTQLLADTLPGAQGHTSWQFFRFGNATRFVAGGTLWTTDGTPAGTTSDLPAVYFRTPVAVTSNAIYFVSYDPDHGFEPWKSDGTAAGTSMIKDVRSGFASPFSSIAIAPTATGAVFFADDGTGGGGRLWTTDGTAANTVPIAAFPASGVANYSTFFFPTSQGILFSAGANVWRTDGTEAGTYIAAAMTGGPSFNFLNAFSKIYFTSWVGQEMRLIQIDGSPNATPVSVRPDVPASDVTFTGGKLWFAGTDATNGSELWVSDDGTTNGTHFVANLAPDPARSSTPEGLTAAGPLVYFRSNYAQKLWRSDGTSGGTIEVSSVTPFEALTPYRGDLYYHRSFSDLYRVDGVNGGATKVGQYEFDLMKADENFIYMWKYSWGHVHRSDGTAAGTFELYDPNEPNHLRGQYDSITVLPYGGFGWIRCYHGIFRTAGTVATTRRVVSMPENWSLIGELVGAGGLLYSMIGTDAMGSELWRSDGTGAGSFVVKDVNPGAAGSAPSNLTPAGRYLYFTATDSTHGTELWRTDGTEEGTFLVKDIRPGTASSAPSEVAAIGEVVYFAANDGTNGIELWKSDGTEAGTVLVRDVAPGSFSSRPMGLAAAGGKVWFAANDGLHGVELWSSDGTEAGTVMVSDIIAGGSSSSPDQLTPAESNVFFTATTDAEGRELWAMPLTTGYLSVTGARTAEGNSGTRPLRFTVTRHGASGGAASVAYATTPGTATAGTDYDSTNGTLQFAAGETVKTVDVVIHGDTSLEANETLSLQLSSPTGVALQDAIAAGVIDDDDPRADLGAEIVQSAITDGEAPRIVTVRNFGPSDAFDVIVTFTESPFDFDLSSSSDVTCTNTLPSRCTIPFLQALDSRTFTIYRQSLKGLVDPSLPPGRTVTVNVTSAVPDTSQGDNTVSQMTTGNGMLLTAPKLVVGTTAVAVFDLGATATSATDVTLTSSAGNVAVFPATLRIPAGQRVTVFGLTTTAGANKTLLTATIAGQTKTALVVPIGASGQPALLDVAIAANNKTTLAYGELFIIPVRVAARYPDGTAPSGLVTLLDQNGTTLAQLALDTTGAATFTRPQPAPGQHLYRVRYDGDARFNPLTASLPAITIQKALSRVFVHAPTLSCSSSVEFRIVVNGPDGSPAPTGSITITSYPNTLGTFTLTPNGLPGESEVTATLPFDSGYRFINAAYPGDAYFAASDGRKDFGVGCTAAMNLAATATSPTSVSLTWASPAQSTNNYAVYRADTIEGQLQAIVTTPGFSAVDTTAQPGHVYLYYVDAFGPIGTPSYRSNLDIASTFVYTDNPLAAGTRIKSGHLTELRTLTAALRTLAALPTLTFTGSVAPGNAVDARHITELRTSIDASRARLGLPAIQWTQPNAVRGALIRAATVQELRGAVN